MTDYRINYTKPSEGRRRGIKETKEKVVKKDQTDRRERIRKMDGLLACQYEGIIKTRRLIEGSIQLECPTKGLAASRVVRQGVQHLELFY